MDWRAACAAVIPCLNEEAAIGPLVRAVLAQLPTVFVVNDGSTDRTAIAARNAGASVLEHPGVLGKGRALRTGWSHACEQGYQWALTLDGDGQHSPQDIPSFFQEAEKASLVVGNRMGSPGEMPLVRRWVNRWMSWQLSRLVGQSLPDSQCGFRLMNLQDWAQLPLVTTHFEVESEVLFSFATSGLPIAFVPIQVIYKSEQSKIHPLRDTLRWLRWRNQARQSLRQIRTEVAGFSHVQPEARQVSSSPVAPLGREK
jgi:glycosyltransferase involved in cell wall biosynthesis